MPRCASGGSPGWRRQAKRRSIKGIDDLLRYFSRAPVFADEHSRRVLMEELESAKETWLEYVRKGK